MGLLTGSFRGICSACLWAEGALLVLLHEQFPRVQLM